MNRVFRQIIIAIFALVLAGCTLNDMEFRNGRGIVNVMGSVADFTGINVGTKATEDDEKKVSEITMAIFDSNGDVVGRLVNVNVTNSDPVFIIDTKHEPPYILAGNETIYIENDQSYLANCNIYMLANLWKDIPKDENGKSTIIKESQLLNLDISVDGITIPDNGFPMMGKTNGINLSASRPAGTQMEDVTMFKLYSKINVSLQINAENVIAIPKFTLTGWKVTNVPDRVKIGEPAENEETNTSGNFGYLTPYSSKEVSPQGKLNVSHSNSLDNPDKLQFTFYIPEHRINPDNPITYPSENMTDAEKQRFKPLLCTDNKKPVYVTIEGIYTDHQEIMHEVTYKLYLGQNSIDDFYVNRNQQINNIVTIKGVTNSHPGTNDVVNSISVDYRVEIETNGNYVVKVERDALLDSHFEVRPMDIYINERGSVDVTVVDESSTDATDKGRIWLRIEESKTGNNYATGGVRKYFTTDLVTNTLKNSNKITVRGEKTRIWLYFDENPNVFDRTLPNSEEYNKQYRDITVKLEYKNSSGIIDDSQTKYITFRQMNLWRLWSYKDDAKTIKNRFYDIEYHEEYLNNYAANEQFGNTKDGMEWGLDNMQLSEWNKSAGNIGSGILGSIIELFGGKVTPYYDFYLERDVDTDGYTTYNYNGKYFTIKIAKKAGISDNITNLYLNGSPSSAVEYCLNKNKRNTNGGINITRDETNKLYSSNEVSWFLPSIDQIEEIVISGYQDFNVFQNKYFWSSQPAFTKNELWEGHIFSADEYLTNMYVDNKEYARSTKVYLENDEWKAVRSDDIIANHKYTTYAGYFTGPTKINNGESEGLGEGYQPRSNINRIRCVRNTGTAD